MSDLDDESAGAIVLYSADPAHDASATSRRTRRSSPAHSCRARAERAKAFARDARAERTRDAYRYDTSGRASRRGARATASRPCPRRRPRRAQPQRVGRGRRIGRGARPGPRAISEAHAVRGHPSPRKAPEVREVWKGIRHRLGTAPRRRAAPVVVDELRQLAAVLDDDPRSVHGGGIAASRSSPSAAALEASFVPPRTRSPTACHYTHPMEQRSARDMPSLM